MRKSIGLIDATLKQRTKFIKTNHFLDSSRKRREDGTRRIQFRFRGCNTGNKLGSLSSPSFVSFDAIIARFFRFLNCRRHPFRPFLSRKKKNAGLREGIVWLRLKSASQRYRNGWRRRSASHCFDSSGFTPAVIIIFNQSTRPAIF